MAENKKPGGILKKLLVWGLGLGALLLITVAMLPFFIHWDQIKDKATAALSDKLHHKVSIESISVGLFDGVSLHKVSIANAAGFGSQPLFFNEHATLRPSLLGLLTGRLVISEISFKKPQLFIVKGENGKFNFSDMLASTAGSTDPGTASSSGSSVPMPDIIVTAFHLSEGEVTYKDLRKGTTTAVKGLDIKLNGLSLKAAGKSRLELRFTAEAEGQKIPLDLVADFKVDVPGQRLDLASAKLKLPALELKLSGVVTEFSGDPKLDMHAEALVELSSLIGLPKEVKASGKIRFTADVKGKATDVANFDMKAVLAFEGVGVKYQGVAALDSMNGALTVGPTSASMPGLNFKLGGSPVTLKLEAKNYTVKGLMAGGDTLRMDLGYDLSSPKLVLDGLLALAGSSDTAPAKAGAAGSSDASGMKDLRSVPKGLSVNGRIKLDALQIQKSQLGALTHVLSLRQRQLRSTADLKLFDGTLWNQADVDFSKLGPAYSFDLRLDKVQFEKAVDAAASVSPKNLALSQLKGKLLGALTLAAKGKGAGSGPALKKNLALNAQFEMTDGTLKSLDLTQKLASVIPHPATQALLRKDIHFGQMGGKVTVAKQKLTLSDFYLSSGADHRQGEILVQASGTQILGGAVDFKIIPHFNPRVVKLEGVIGDGFNDELGWATYNPITYKGENSDTAKADFKSGVGNAAKKVVTKALGDKAKDLMKNLPGGLQNLFGH